MFLSALFEGEFEIFPQQRPIDIAHACLNRRVVRPLHCCVNSQRSTANSQPSWNDEKSLPRVFNVGMG
jgi:hypothetical protein